MEEDERNKQRLAENYVNKYIWLVRPCDEYEDEVKECSSVSGRFHQLFIHGEVLDCSKWNQDLKNCKACLEDKNSESCKSIIINETERRLKRISGAKQNDVWKRRDKPPENWNSPLSEYWLSRNEKSLLLHNREEYKEYVATHEPDRRYSCTII